MNENVMFAMKMTLVMSIIHDLFSCDFFKNERKLYLKSYFYVNPNICKYRELLTSNHETTLIKLAIKICWNYYAKDFFILFVSKRLHVRENYSC